ncbi:MAG: ABC transporter permease [Prevotella sp.]|nr:ABC transporter permease [Prevotella sp.]
MNQRKKRERITDAERKEAYKEASRFVLDIAKLVFAGVILGSIMDMDINKGFVFGVGLIIVICLIILGGLLYYFAIKKY